MALLSIASKPIRAVPEHSALADNCSEVSQLQSNMVLASYCLESGGTSWIVSWRGLLLFKVRHIRAAAFHLHRSRRILVFSKQSNHLCPFMGLEKTPNKTPTVFSMKVLYPLQSLLLCSCFTSPCFQQYSWNWLQNLTLQKGSL